MKTLIKGIALAVLVAAVAGAGYYWLVSPQLSRDKSSGIVADKLFGWKYPIAKFPAAGPGDKLAYSDIRDPGGIPQGLPVRLKIPTISVDSTIEDALITPDGRMDVPAGSKNVAWFSLGPHPGQKGSAVIGGHFGITKGVPFVFYNLDKLKVGDKIYVEDDTGSTLAFQVRSIKSFDRNADTTTVFTSSDGKAHLNLITCEGIWNQINGSYPQRLVVFTDAIPAEGAVVVTKPTIATKTTPIPTKAVASKPKFPEAAIITPELPSPSTLPTEQAESTPAAAITTPSSEEKSPPVSQVITASAKSLYATPTDGLITSFLLVSIVATAFKVITG